MAAYGDEKISAMMAYFKRLIASARFAHSQWPSRHASMPRAQHATAIFYFSLLERRRLCCCGPFHAAASPPLVRRPPTPFPDFRAGIIADAATRFDGFLDYFARCKRHDATGSLPASVRERFEDDVISSISALWRAPRRRSTLGRIRRSAYSDALTYFISPKIFGARYFPAGQRAGADVA